MASHRSIEKQLIDISYDLHILAIDMKYLFAMQKHLIEYLAANEKLDRNWDKGMILNRIESLRARQKLSA